MLLQTNSYIVPKDKRSQHARLVQRFRQTLSRLGCDHFEAYEQVGANWSPADTTGRFVQLMRFRDRKHQLAVQGAERSDATAQGLIKEFCELINFPYQQQQGLFAVGFYHSLLPPLMSRPSKNADESEEILEDDLVSENPPQEGTAEREQQSTENHAFDEPQIESPKAMPISLALATIEDESSDADISDVDALLDEMESSEESTDSESTSVDVAEEKNAGSS